jgi:hypothetical protein
MKRALLPFVFLGAISAVAQLPGPSGVPAKNFEMKIFTAEGPLSMIVRGSEVAQRGPNRLDFVDLNITSFNGQPDQRVDSILLAPTASFFPKENRASGEDSVRVIRMRTDKEVDMELTGEKWTYLYASRKVTIQKKTHVVYHAELPNLL